MAQSTSLFRVVVRSGELSQPDAQRASEPQTWLHTAVVVDGRVDSELWHSPALEGSKSAVRWQVACGAAPS